MARVTKLVCPSCKGAGTGVFGACMWCHGDKRLPTEDALRYASQLYMIAGGGYICGDHDYDDMLHMEAEAERIYALAQADLPWKSRSPAAMERPRP